MMTAGGGVGTAAGGACVTGGGAAAGRGGGVVQAAKDKSRTAAALSRASRSGIANGRGKVESEDIGPFVTRLSLFHETWTEKGAVP